MFTITEKTITEKTLTDYEQIGFQATVNLADGHAYQELGRSQELIVERLGDIWHESQQQTIPGSEDLYLQRFAALIDSPGLLRAAGHSILPTASNSIDLVGAYLHGLGSRVLLTHPTFDNLALLLRRRGVQPQPISEIEINDACARQLRLREADALFLVNPNNPTGTSLERAKFSEIVESCVANDVTIIIDACFRLFYEPTWDAYQLLQDAGASYIVFEDTGKVFPTQDMKASILSCSNDHRTALAELYNEVYLCVSKFSLCVLGEFFDDADKIGLRATLHSLVADRRDLLRRALPESAVEPVARDSRISVEWLSTSLTGLSDLEVVDSLYERGVGVLPGRGFFWNRAGEEFSERNVRVSLMKPRRQFELGVELLAEFFAESARV